MTLINISSLIILTQKKIIAVRCSRPWTPPANWTSNDEPAYYMDFENLDCIKLNNGANHTDDGKVLYTNMQLIIAVLF